MGRVFTTHKFPHRLDRLELGVTLKLSHGFPTVVGATRKVLTRKVLTRKVLNFNIMAKSGPDSPLQASGHREHSTGQRGQVGLGLM